MVISVNKKFKIFKFHYIAFHLNHLIFVEKKVCIKMCMKYKIYRFVCLYTDNHTRTCSYMDVFPYECISMYGKKKIFNCLRQLRIFFYQLTRSLYLNGAQI